MSPGNLLGVLYNNRSTETHPRLMTDKHLTGEILVLAALGTCPDRLKELQAVSRERFNPAKYHTRKP